MVDQMAEANEEVDKKVGSLFLFHIGGMALLTLVINAPLCAPLLRLLGVTKDNEIDELVTENMEALIDEKTSKGRQSPDVAAMVPPLGHDQSRDSEEKPILGTPGQKEACRIMLMQAVLRKYWKAIDGGQLSGTSRVARVLVLVSDEVIQQPSQTLQDWEKAASYLSQTPVIPGISHICEMRPFKYTDLKEIFPSTSRMEKWHIQAALNFVSAHEAATETCVAHIADLKDVSEEARDALKTEAEKQVSLAKKFLSEQNAAQVRKIKCQMAAERLFEKQRALVKEMFEGGLLTRKDADHLQETMHYEQKEAARLDREDKD
jgi:rubrerythrin